MREITDPVEWATACGGDLLLRWAGQGLVQRPGGRSRAWMIDGALAVAAPDLSTRDRLAVHATDHARALELVRTVLAEVGPTYRPLGEPALIDTLTAGIPGLRPVREFGWMERAARGAAPAGTAQWLPPDSDHEIAALLDVANPDSDARPGLPGVERWAGIRDADGALLAVAALAWSAPGIGFLSGVATHPANRGKGLGTQVSGFTVRETLAVHGTVALMVDDWNTPAIALYERLGLSHRTVRAAAFE